MPNNSHSTVYTLHNIESREYPRIWLVLCMRISNEWLQANIRRDKNERKSKNKKWTNEHIARRQTSELARVGVCVVDSVYVSRIGTNVVACVIS